MVPPCDALAPVIVEELLVGIRGTRRDKGPSAITAELHPQAIPAISDHVTVPDRGTVVHGRTAAALSAQPALLDRLLGLARADLQAPASEVNPPSALSPRPRRCARKLSLSFTA